MRIVCPTCDAEYEVQDHLLRPGRATRCARCGDKWVPLAGAEAPEPLAVPEPLPVPVLPLPSGPTAMERLSVPIAEPKGWVGLRLAWIGTILLLIGSVAGLYVERTSVMAAWSPSQRLFAVFGLASVPESPHPMSEPR